MILKSVNNPGRHCQLKLLNYIKLLDQSLVSVLFLFFFIYIRKKALFLVMKIVDQNTYTKFPFNTLITIIPKM